LGNACTAAETFVILNPFNVFVPKLTSGAAVKSLINPSATSAHDAVPEAFAQLLLNNDQRFALTRAWRTNQINQIGYTAKKPNEKTETLLTHGWGSGHH
jgi:hypothetical protein